jgi:Right handed beta helix region
MAMRRIALACTAVTAALLSAQAADTARAKSTVACGATITADTVLRADLTGCKGTAIVVGADDVTLDLDSHRVDGAIVAQGRSGVRVRGGVVRGDVRLEEVRHASVRRLRVRGGSITCVHSAGCSVTRSILTGGGIAIAQSESGIPNVIRANLVRNAPGSGIAADRTDTTTITRNVVRRSDIGIETSHAADIEIARNVLSGNADDGLSGSFGSTATIVRNLITGNGGDGVSLRVWGGDTLIAHNLVRGNRANGIAGAAVAHWSVTRNVASGNGASGLVITGAVEDVTLARNRARGNGGLGIDIVSGVTDGGGNRAASNAAGQCAGIRCI